MSTSFRRSIVLVEVLESRELLSAATLRVVSYNIAADVDGYTTPRPGLYDVLEAIGAHTINGTTKPIDVLALQETTSNTATVQPIVDALNSYYGAGTYAMSPFQATESGNNPSIGNGPNALVYNTHTLTLLQSYGLPGPFGSTSGMYRQVMRYEFQAVGGTSASDFYVYDAHAKSGSTSTDLTYRNEEAQLIRADEATLAATARVLYVGDFNLRTSSEASYQTLTASGQGQAFDPINQPGNWYNNSAFAGIMSDSSTSLRYRTDFEFATSNVMTDSTGFKFNGDYEAFGNNGSVAVGSSVANSSNTALADLSNRSTILQELTTASDHLPIVVDFTDPLATTTSGTVLGWDVNGQTNFGTQGLKATTLAGDTNSLGLTRGSGVGTSGTAVSNGWGGNNWASTASAGISGSKFVTFGLTVSSGYNESLSAIDLFYRRSSTGPTSGYWQYQVNGGAWTLIGSYANEFSSTSTSGASITELNLGGIGSLQNLASGTVVNFRLTPYGATSSSGTWYVYNHSGNDLYVKGSYTPTASAATTVTPTTFSSVTIDDTDDLRHKKH